MFEEAVEELVNPDTNIRQEVGKRILNLHVHPQIFFGHIKLCDIEVITLCNDIGG